MASLESLPADQRAVLQLVLQRGRSYGDIARMLSIDRSAVRHRAVTALTALGPQTGLADDRRQLITDYLLGQLDADAAQAARGGIAASPGERAWARVVASELAPLTSAPLPEIPTAADPASPVPAQPAPAPEAASAPPAPTPAGEEPKRRRGRLGRRRRDPPAEATAAPEPKLPAGDESGRRSSRLGGAVLILLTVIIVAAVVVIFLAGQDNSGSTPAASRTATSTPAASTPTSAAPAGTTTASASSAAKVVAQINLTPPTGVSKVAGIAEVLRQGSSNGIAIVAQNVPPNTTKPPNAYAVWLYNSAADAHILGFVNPGVGSNGRLSTAGGLPTNTSHYKQLIVTLEKKASPRTPGTIVLQGTLPAGL